MLVEISLNGGTWDSPGGGIRWDGDAPCRGVRVDLGAGESCFPAPGSELAHDEPSHLLVAVSGYLARSGARVFRVADSARLLFDAYLKEGAQALHSLDGQYCALVIDLRQGAVAFASDKLGQGQAYLHAGRGKAVFSTSLRRLKHAVAEPLEVDPASIGELLTLGFVPAPSSMFRNVMKLEPAAHVTLDAGGIRPGQYYNLRTDRTLDLDSGRLNSSITEHLGAATRRGLSLGEHWGSFLSGGLDSSSVVWALSREVPCETYFATFGSLDSYMAIPDDERVASRVADAFGTRHHVVKIGPEAIGRAADIVRAIEEPFCDGGPIVLDAVSRMASIDGCDALATGNGGDFLFAGERRHLLASLFSNKALGPLWMLARLINALPHVAGSERIARFRFDIQRCLALRNLSVEEFYSRRFGLEETVARVIAPDLHFAKLRSPIAAVRKELDHVHGMPDLSKMLYLDLRLLTPNLIVRDVRCIADAHGLRTFHPYLDQQFVEMAMALPPHLKVRGLTLKHALRKAMRPHLPGEVFTKRKGGLGAPILYWVTDPKGPVADMLSKESIERRGVFDFAAIDQLRRETCSRQYDHSMLLWTAFTTELWMREFLDGHGATEPGG